MARYVALRDGGLLPGKGPERRERIIDPFMGKLEEWVERSERSRITTCELVGVPRSSFYAWTNHVPSARDLADAEG